METVDYATREDLVAAVVDAQKRGLEVEVVGNGLTLQFPSGIGATPEDETTAEEDESLLGVVEPTLDPVEIDDEEEDLIGDVEPTADPEVVKFVNEKNVDEVLEAVEVGLFTAEQAVLAEQVGKKRKGILSLVDEG